MSAADYVTAGATTATALFLGVGLYYWIRDRAPKVYLEQLDEPPPLRPDGMRVIRVRASSAIEKCRVAYAGRELETYLPNGVVVRETMLYAGGILNFRVPQGLPLVDDNYVEVKDGDKTLRREKLGRINPAPTR